MPAGKYAPKPINEQVIVITDASSRVGLELAKRASSQGARVVLGARRREDIDDLADEINSAPGRAIAVTTDVSKFSDLMNLKNKAISKFGRIDTWINNAANSIYGYVLDSDINEERKLFETNFWGSRYGSQVAVEAMAETGGVLINFGSEVSVSAQPLLGIYASSKDALKSFTDALRSEIRDKDLHIEVCLLRPASISDENPVDTADAVLKCAEHPQRDVYVGGPARLSAILETFFPQVKDMVAESKMKDLKKENVDETTAELSAIGVLKTLKENFKFSLKENRKPEEQ